MTDEADTSRARLEAARWFARLSRTAITTEALKEFRAWKASPDNARAYAHIESTWAQAGRLAHDQDLKELTDRTLRKRPARRTRARRATWVAATTGAIGTATAIAALVLLARPEAYATKPGEQRLIVLADGSRVRLNTDSQVTVRLERAQRRLTLRKGEAFFEVAHDPGRPFIVAADGAEVRALGTRFDVRREAGGVQVTLLEGQVRVTRQTQDTPDGPTTALLRPNQRLTVTRTTITLPAPADAQAAASWTTGRLTFHNLPLREAVAEVNRYTQRKLVLEAPPEIATAPVTGVFDVGDTQAFTAAAQSLFDLQVQPLPGGGARLQARPGATPPA